MKENLENNVAIEKLRRTLRGTFPKLEIITLEKYVKKIAVVSKVRVGDNRSYNNYDEVTPTHLNEYGELVPYKGGKELGLAYKTLLYSQTLKPNDLLISYRGSKHYSVGRAAKKYDRITVGNNAAIRVEFEDNINEEVPLIVQSFLNKSYAQEYLKSVASIPKESKYPRKSISSKILLELPIPKFEIYSSLYTQTHFYNLELLSSLKELSNYSERIQHILEKDIQNDLEVYTLDKNSYSKKKLNQDIINGLIAQLKASLENL